MPKNNEKIKINWNKKLTAFNILNPTQKPWNTLENVASSPLPPHQPPAFRNVVEATYLCNHISTLQKEREVHGLGVSRIFGEDCSWFFETEPGKSSAIWAKKGSHSRVFWHLISSKITLAKEKEKWRGKTGGEEKKALVTLLLLIVSTLEMIFGLVKYI